MRKSCPKLLLLSDDFIRLIIKFTERLRYEQGIAILIDDHYESVVPFEGLSLFVDDLEFFR